MKRNLLVCSLVIPAFALSLMGAAFPDPPAEQLAPAGAKKATVVLAGGCFWGMEGVYEHVKGVTGTTVGYTGGEKKTARYEMVGTGTTGHAESIQITWDPSVITFGQILKIYFHVAHDPTTLNRQHNDEGPQYRSEIFYADDAQKEIAEKYIKILNEAKVFKNPIVTKLGGGKTFYAAEQYHQRYLDNHPTEPYIVAFDQPKIVNLKAAYPEWYKK